LKRVARLLRLDPRQRKLLLEAGALLSAVSPLVRYAPSGVTGRVIRRASVSNTARTDPQLAADVAHAVLKVAESVPYSTCLARALTGWIMLARRRQAATVRLGVSRAASGITAHAWLECNGQRVIGGETSHEYIPFPTIP